LGNCQSTCNATSISTNSSTFCSCPDVYLEVPNLTVTRITLLVSSLTAHVSLSANVGSLLSINSGVDVNIKQVNLTITGVHAQVQLQARLGNLVKMLDRAFTSLDRNPNLLTDLVQSVDGLLSSVLNQTLGQIIQRVVDQSGNIIQKILSEAGSVLSQNIVGNVLGLPLVSSTVNSLGQTVKVFLDPSSNTQIQVVLDSTGKILSTKILQ